MDLLQLLILLTIAGICAAIAEIIVARRAGGGNVVITIIVGVVGAYLGAWLATMLSTTIPLPRYAVTVGAIQLDLIWATIGSLLILLALSVVRTTGRLNLDRR